MNSPHTATLPIEVQVSGELPPGIAEYLEERVRSVLRFAHRPVLYARARVTRHGNPALAHPVLAQANIDVNGQLVRAQVAGGTAHEAVDLLRDRLQRRLQDLQRADRRTRRPPDSAEGWRHGDIPTQRPPYYPRPPEEREIVRRKSVTAVPSTLDEAVFDLDVMDYDFHLFTELGSGQDSVIYRAGPTGYRLAQVEPQPEALAPHAVSVTVSDQPAAELSTAEAMERMALSNQPFLFFRDVERGRGALLYRRYDGHYGLITPAE